ncbi:MAG: hypothetical protein ACREGJ_04995 [Candidatus Saccharimonadales bacterium]
MKNEFIPENGQEFRAPTEQLKQPEDSLFTKAITSEIGLRALVLTMGIAGGIMNKIDAVRDSFTSKPDDLKF